MRLKRFAHHPAGERGAPRVAGANRVQRVAGARRVQQSAGARRARLAVGALLATLLLTGASSHGIAPFRPGMWAGVLPCADCSGVRTSIEFRADSLYVMRSEYLGTTRGRDTIAVELGRWQLVANGKRVLLGGNGATARQYVIAVRGLRMLDLNGNEIATSANLTLERQDQVVPVNDTFHLRGMYRYMADAGILEECRSGWRLPVAQQKDNAALERAYGKAKHAPGAPVMVSLDGHLDLERAESGDPYTALIVDRFEAVHPGEQCTSAPPAVPHEAKAAATLENTKWKLIEIGGLPFAVTAGEREVFIQLDPKEHRLSGQAQCNRLSSGYALHDSSLTFTPMASTRMACPGMNDEDAVLKALGSTTGYRVRGQTLELLAGRVVTTRFIATK
jgi:copper homeostasis protein (lipoprotein)